MSQEINHPVLGALSSRRPRPRGGGSGRPRNVHLDRAALRPGQSRPLVQHRPLWWWRAARQFDAILKRPEARVLDLCCGTGDMAFALYRRTALQSRANSGRGFFSRHAAARGGEGAREKEREGKRRDALLDRGGRAAACRFPIDISIWLHRHSVFETWPTTTRACVKSRGCSLPAENAASWISANRAA